MSRTLDSDLQTRSQSGVFGYVVFIELQFPSGTVYAHNGQGTISFGGNDYLGVGAFGSIDVIAESIDTVPNPIRLTLSSITQEIIDAVITDDIYGKTANIYVGALNEDLELIGTPTQWVGGYMEKKELLIGSLNGVQITIQDEAAKLRQRNNKRFTIEDHQEEHTGDLFLEYLPFVQDAKITWAGERVRTGFRNTGGLGQPPDTGPEVDDPDFYR